MGYTNVKIALKQFSESFRESAIKLINFENKNNEVIKKRAEAII